MDGVVDRERCAKPVSDSHSIATASYLPGVAASRFPRRISARCTAACLCITALASGATGRGAGDQLATGGSLAIPSVQATSIAYRYASPRDLRSIRDVNFGNLRIVIFDAKGRPAAQFPLRNGRLERARKIGGEEVDIGRAHYFKDPQNGTERALVDLGWTSVGGSSGTTGILLVFEVRDGRLSIIQQINYDMHAPGTLYKFYPGTRVLIVLGRTADDSPHCCPKSLDEVTFGWNGKEFQAQSVQRLFFKEH